MIASARRILKGRYLVMSLLLCVALPTQAQWFNWFSPDEPLQVVIDDAFINVYAGPGSGYPIFHVVEREEVITLLYSRTDWIKIKTKIIKFSKLILINYLTNNSKTIKYFIDTYDTFF